ncbi:MAG TPA: serine protease [Ferruginibacter sp.]|nr:serine protease [Ferruginibacter sp.]
MKEPLLIDAVERFIRGEMPEQERIYFEEMRKTNPELDQAVVEHIFFLNELSKYSSGKNFRNKLSEVETTLVQEGFITKNSLKGKARIIYLWKNYKRTMAVAASIAGFVTILVASIFSSITTHKVNNITPLVEKLNQQENKTRQIENKVNQLAAASPVVIKPKLEARFRATGFLIDAGNNFIITNAHVVKEARNALIIENSKGEEFSAEAVYVDDIKDLAIIKITDSNFKRLPSLPFNIRKSNAGLGEQVFMLGYPKQEIVYGEGYVSAKNGYLMDTIYCQLSTAANEGSSGSPVITKNGDLIGILSSSKTNSQGVVYAIKSANIFQAIEEAKKLKQSPGIKISTSPALRGLDRVSQIKKVEEYVFMIKGN